MQFGRLLSLAVASYVLILLSQAIHGEDIYRKRFNPPRADFMHANMIKNGVASGIKGQNNFLTVYLAPIDTTDSPYQADGFSYSLLLPAFVQMLDKEEQGLVVTETTFDGKPYWKITRMLDAKQMRIRCLKATYGIEETLWFRLNDVSVPAEPQVIRMSLYYKGKICSTTEAKLKIFDKLVMPPVLPAKHFKFYLHSNRFRTGRYDEMAGLFRKAGFNSILLRSANAEAIKAMHSRGFYTIVQRSGSYSKVLREFQKCLSDGPAWFIRHDGGQMEKCLPHCDAVLWDFEPRPDRFNSLPADEWSIKEFRKAANIAENIQLNEEIIKVKYLKQWIEFRQKQLAIPIKHWVDFCHSINPNIETIITEGRSNRIDPSEQIDYRNYSAYVTYCDPMNTNMLRSVYGLKEWMDWVPQAEFLGCQNLALPGKRILYGPKVSMLQVLSSVMVGCKGNSIFPGRAMDAADFVVYNRVMNFIGKNQQVIFEGQADPKNVTLVPSLKRDAIHRVYFSKKNHEYLAVVCNWHAIKTSQIVLKIDQARGKWLLIDEENQTRFTLNGIPVISQADLVSGISLLVPPSDYRGFRLLKASQKELARIRHYRSIELNDIAVLANNESPVLTPKDPPGNQLLFHLNFNKDANAADGKTKATVTEKPVYEKTPNGRAIRISDETELSFLPQGNINLRKGRLDIRFKPLWNGSDDKSHMLLQVKPVSGLLYFGKLSDDRLVFNMIGAKGKQHYTSVEVRKMKAGEWHKATILWDCDKGRMTLYLDGENVAEYENDPWQMGKLDNHNPKCGIRIPSSAEIMLDELKIWRLQ